MCRTSRPASYCASASTLTIHSPTAWTLSVLPTRQVLPRPSSLSFDGSVFSSPSSIQDFGHLLLSRLRLLLIRKWARFPLVFGVYRGPDGNHNLTYGVSFRRQKNSNISRQHRKPDHVYRIERTRSPISGRRFCTARASHRTSYAGGSAGVDRARRSHTVRHDGSASCSSSRLRSRRSCSEWRMRSTCWGELRAMGVKIAICVSTTCAR